MNYSEEIIQKIWEKGRATPDQDSTLWRKDQCGAWMMREVYEQEHSEYGWKVRSILPGDSGAIKHLRPFHRENVFNGASRKLQCQVTADRTSLRSTDHIDHPLNKNL
jgi:hypothetical protein